MWLRFTWQPTKTPFYLLLFLEGIWAICWIVAMFWFLLDNFGLSSPTHDIETLRIHLHLLALHANVPLALVILAYAREALFGWTPFFWLFFSLFVDLAIVFVSFLHIHPNPIAMTNALYFMQFLSVYALVLTGLASVVNAGVWMYASSGGIKAQKAKEYTLFKDETVVEVTSDEKEKMNSKMYHRIK